MALLLFYSVVFVCLVGSNAMGGGLVAHSGVAMSLDGIDATIRNSMPKIIASVKKMKIPPFSLDSHGVHIDVESVTIESLECNNCTTVNLNPSDAFTIGLINVEIDVKLHTHVKWAFLHDTIEITAHTDNAGAVTKVFPTVSDGKLHLTPHGTGGSAGDLHLHASGGIDGWILNIVLNAVRGDIESSIAKAMTTGINEAISKDLNGQLAKLPTVLNFPSNDNALASMSVAFAANPSVSTVDISLLDVAYGQPGPHCPRPIPAMPKFAAYTPRIDEPKLPDYVTATVDDGTLSSTLWSMAACGAFNSAVWPAFLDKAGKIIALNTSDVSVFAPELWTKYPHKWMKIEFNMPVEVDGKPSGLMVTIGASQFTATLPLAFNFSVITSGTINATGYPVGSINTTQVFSLFCPAAVTGTVAVQNVIRDGRRAPLFVPSLSKVSCSARLLSSQVGDVYLGPLNFALSEILDHGLPIINHELAAGWLLPPLPIPVDITDVKLTLDEHYLHARASFMHVSNASNASRVA